MSTSTWMDFFVKAGIPPQASATYNLLFEQNNIKADMIQYLNKDRLKKIGITIVGDIIAILRHAKHVQEQAETGKPRLGAGNNMKTSSRSVFNRLGAKIQDQKIIKTAGNITSTRKVIIKRTKSILKTMRADESKTSTEHKKKSQAKKIVSFNDNVIVKII